MKLYKHYKNKYYRLKGYVRHSETLEEMALYDCLYANELGQAWVRPKELFHGNHEGRPRFAEIPLEIEMQTHVGSDQIENLDRLSHQVFGNSKRDDLISRLQGRSALVQFAKVENQMVGFKAGYELIPKVFYSWLGGVLPEFRKLGIAQDLMAAQHEWCRKQGYELIQTKSQNQFPAMISLNLRNGFQIIGTEQGSSGLKVLMEKRC